MLPVRCISTTSLNNICDVIAICLVTDILFYIAIFWWYPIMLGYSHIIRNINDTN